MLQAIMLVAAQSQSLCNSHLWAEPLTAVSGEFQLPRARSQPCEIIDVRPGISKPLIAS